MRRVCLLDSRCVFLSFFPTSYLWIVHVHQNRDTWTLTTLSLYNKGIVCVFIESHRDSTIALRMEILSTLQPRRVCGASVPDQPAHAIWMPETLANALCSCRINPPYMPVKEEKSPFKQYPWWWAGGGGGSSAITVLPSTFVGDDRCAFITKTVCYLKNTCSSLELSLVTAGAHPLLLLAHNYTMCHTLPVCVHDTSMHAIRWCTPYGDHITRL